MVFNNNYLMTTTELLESSDTNKKQLDDLKEKIRDKKVDGSVIKETLLKIYKSDARDLANEVPSIGEIIRLTIFVGIPTAINPLFGLFSYIADRTIKDAANAKVIYKYIKSYEKQIATAEKEIKSCKDKDKKKQLEDHLDDLKRGLGNLESKKYELDDKENGAVYKKLKDVNEKEVSEAVNLIEMEYLILTQEQKLILFDDSDEFLSEALDGAKQAVDAKLHDAGAKVEQMDNWFNKAARDIKLGFTNDAKDDIIEDNIPKFSKMVKRAIILGFTWAVNPAIAVITAAAAFALSKKGKESQRQMILRDLNNELEMVEEKIKDADSNSEKEKKYQLMRLRQTIQSNRDKIQRRVVV
jgi:hypothetical protein